MGYNQKAFVEAFPITIFFLVICSPGGRCAISVMGMSFRQPGELSECRLTRKPLKCWALLLHRSTLRLLRALE